MDIPVNYSIAELHTPEVWWKGLEQIWNHGHIAKIIYDGKPIETVEMLGLRTQIYLPDKGAIPDDYIWKDGSPSWEDYKAEFLNADTRGFIYSYGERLRSWGAGKLNDPDNQPISIDQLDYIIRELKRDRSSRRATAVTWIPPFDEKTESPPCLMSFQAFIRGDRLTAIVPYRSHDFFGAYPANAYGLTGVMEYIVDRVGNCSMGNLIFLSSSAHIYWFNWPDVAKILNDSQEVPVCKRLKLGAISC